ncbi:hypothetical protein TWF694_007450 [Orbilia ellipsospora]|uniref:PH domain-containing protein n=1 Tax=Orbilia ellipsospora TaxID=2528407 RepID=A0AAV9XL62_9PEZI
MEGILSVPPERNLLSRGNWKNRYVVLGPRKIISSNTPASAPRKMSAVGVMSDEDLGVVEDVFATQSDDDFQSIYGPDMRLSIYRQRLDPEPIVSYPLECITSCYVGDIAHRKAFSSMSKTTYNPLCPTLVVNVQVDPSYTTYRRKGTESPNASVTQLYDPDDGKITLFFRSGPKDIPPLSIWCREIQSYLRTQSQSRRASSVTFGGDRIRRQSAYRVGPYDHQIAEDEWEDEHSSHPMISTTRSSEESAESRSSGRGGPRPFSTLTMHEFGRGASSSNQSPIDPHDMSPSMGSDYMAQFASMSNSPRRETILDRAFSMNYIPSSPTAPDPNYLSTPPLNSVARFEAVAADPAFPREYHYDSLNIDPSVMPASFFQQR